MKDCRASTESPNPRSAELDTISALDRMVDVSVTSTHLRLAFDE